MTTLRVVELVLSLLPRAASGVTNEYSLREIRSNYIFKLRLHCTSMNDDLTLETESSRKIWKLLFIGILGLQALLEWGKALGMSGSYLSDLLRVETERSAKDHIHA